MCVSGFVFINWVCTDAPVCVCVFQHCAPRSVRMVGVCLLIRASVSLAGEDWTAPVVSALHI